jgi:hypothetical protein
MRKTLRQVHDELSRIRNVSTGDAHEVRGHLTRGRRLPARGAAEQQRGQDVARQIRVLEWALKNTKRRGEWRNQDVLQQDIKHKEAMRKGAQAETEL